MKKNNRLQPGTTVQLKRDFYGGLKGTIPLVRRNTIGVVAEAKGRRIKSDKCPVKFNGWETVTICPPYSDLEVIE